MKGDVAPDGGSGDVKAGHQNDADVTYVAMDPPQKSQPAPPQQPRGRRPNCQIRCYLSYASLIMVVLALCSLALALVGYVTYVMLALNERPSEEFVVGSHAADEDAHRDESLVADQLKQQVRVLCWVMTCPDNHKMKARHVKATWGQHCNTLLFFSSEDDAELGTIKLDVKEGKDFLWDKTKGAFSFVHAHYRDEADWFLKADDDTYVILENLRFMLSTHDPSDPVYYGARLKYERNTDYMLGGPGYVLSKGALDLFVEVGLENCDVCNLGQGKFEDVEMGTCMANLGVRAGDSRDVYGRSRFFWNSPEVLLLPRVVQGKPFIGEWPAYYETMYYAEEPGLNGFSDTAISFHKITPNMMYTLEYLIYHLRPYGISSPHLHPNSTIPRERESTTDKKEDRGATLPIGPARVESEMATNPNISDVVSQ